MIGWLLGRDNDRTGECVSAVERALWTLEHLDLRNVGQFLVQGVRIRLQHAVDDEGEVGFRIARSIDAANDDLHVASLGRLHLGDVRGQGDEVLRPFDAGGLDVGGSKNLDGRRHIAEPFRTLAGRDHDLFERVDLSRRLG